MSITDTRRPFSLYEVDQQIPLRAWWAVFFVVPVARRLIWFLVNYTKLTANSVTCISICFRFTAIVLFLFADNYLACFAGALSVYLAYTLDYSDGAVARLKNMSSEFGRYLDHVSDLIGDVLILCALAYSQDMLFSIMCLSMIFMHIAECYISYLTAIGIESPEITNKHNTIFTLINNYRGWWFNRNMKSFLSFSDYTAFVFIFCPLICQLRIGLSIGFFFILLTTCYTIFSSFIAIHTKVEKFP